MRVEGVVLEDHGDIALAGLEPRDVFTIDEDAAAGDRLKSCEGAQGGGLTAAGRADEDEKLAIRNLEIEVFDRGVLGAGIGDADVLKSDLCHAHTLAPAADTVRVVEY